MLINFWLWIESDGRHSFPGEYISWIYAEKVYFGLVLLYDLRLHVDTLIWNKVQFSV